MPVPTAPQLTIESCEPSPYHQAWLRERPQDYGEDMRTLLELGGEPFKARVVVRGLLV